MLHMKHAKNEYKFQNQKQKGKVKKRKKFTSSADLSVADVLKCCESSNVDGWYTSVFDCCCDNWWLIWLFNWSLLFLSIAECWLQQISFNVNTKMNHVKFHVGVIFCFTFLIFLITKFKNLFYFFSFYFKWTKLKRSSFVECSYFVFRKRL